MANNRLYIQDTESGETFMLAKSSGDGWYIWSGEQGPAARVEQLTQWLESRDQEASLGNTNDSPTKLRLVTENDPSYLETSSDA